METKQTERVRKIIEAQAEFVDVVVIGEFEEPKAAAKFTPALTMKLKKCVPRDAGAIAMLPSLQLSGFSDHQ